MIFQRALLYNLYEHEEEEEEEEDVITISSLSPNLGGLQASVKKFTYICPGFAILRELTAIKAKKLKKKKLRAFIFINRDVFVALTVVVAKASYIHECDRSILLLLQTPINKCGKVSG